MLLRRYSNGVEILSVDENGIRKSLEKIAIEIKNSHPDVKDIILFGSFSKMDFTPYSDLDIAIIVNKTGKRFVERTDDFIDYFMEIPLDTNLIVYTVEEIDRMTKSGDRFIKEIGKGIRLINSS
jgi:predicted nucleotidyltransferase